MKRFLSPIAKILLCSLTLAGLLLVGKPYAGAAASAPLWGQDAPDPTATVLDEDYHAPDHAGEYCRNEDFTIDLWHQIDNFGDGIYTTSQSQYCAIDGTYGSASTDLSNLLKLKNSAKAYHVSVSTLAGNILQVPNSKSLFAGGGGGGLAAYDNPLENFELGPGAIENGTHYKSLYNLSSNALPRVLYDSAGQRVSKIHTIDSSPNGEWLIAERGQQILRIKADNFDMLAFPTRVGNLNPDWYSDPDDDLAISNDGRYAAVGGGYGSNLMLYDLSTCAPDLNYNLNNATGCDPDVLKIPNFLSDKLGAKFLHADQLRFSQDGTELFMRVLVQYSSGAKQNKFVMLQAPGTSQNNNYIALGDSYASGEGTRIYFTGTDEKDNKCHLGIGSYPYLLKSTANLGEVHSVACSGARIVNVNGAVGGTSQYKVRPPDNSLGDWLPGYNAQISYISEHQPKIITIAMGGNDIGFSNIILNCILPGTCYNHYEQRDGLVEDIDGKFDNLVDLYTQLKLASPASRVYVVGYPQVAQADGSCASDVHLNNDEIVFSNQLVSYFDDVIKQAAAKAGVDYVDTENAFDGHRLCDVKESSDLMLAMNGLAAGNDNFGVEGNESYHPTVLGHELLAQTIAQQTSNFTASMPEPDESIDGPDPAYATDFLDAPKAGGPVRRAIFAEDAKLPEQIGSTVKLTFNSSTLNYELKPMANYTIWLHSDPVQLGTATTDADGNLNYTYTIPADTAPGWHHIDVYGNDINDHPIDVEQLIYVAASADDWDGDGIPNAQEPCGLFDASGVDADKDSIDDACDGVISKPPVPAAPTVSITNPVNAASEQHVRVSGFGEPGTTAHISVDDTNPDTKAVTATATLPSSDADTASYTQSLDVSSLDDGKLTVSVTLSNDNGASPATTAGAVKDTKPPTITAVQDPAANGAGWNNQTVKLQLNASDTGTGVAGLTYSATGAQPINVQSIDTSSTSFTISAEGKTLVTYTATDKAGNTTTAQTKTIQIDTEPPTTSIDQPQGPVLFGIFGNVLTGTTTDNWSGAATTQVTFVSQEHKKITTTLQATCMSGCGTAETSWQVDTNHLPSGLYTVTASSVDQAGNSGSATSQLRVVIVNFPWLWL